MKAIWVTLKSAVKNRNFYILEHDGYCCLWWAYMYKFNRKEVLRYAKKLWKSAPLKTWTYGKFDHGNLYSVSKLSKLLIKTECLQNLNVSIWKYLFPLSWAYTYLYLLAWQFSIEPSPSPFYLHTVFCWTFSPPPSTSTQLSFNIRFSRFLKIYLIFIDLLR